MIKLFYVFMLASIVMEIPHGTESMGSGIEESVVDGIIQLEHREDNVLPMVLKVFKMRGTSINREPHVCTISRNGGMILYPKRSLSRQLHRRFQF